MARRIGGSTDNLHDSFPADRKLMASVGLRAPRAIGGRALAFVIEPRSQARKLRAAVKGESI